MEWPLTRKMGVQRAERLMISVSVVTAVVAVAAVLGLLAVGATGAVTATVAVMMVVLTLGVLEVVDVGGDVVASGRHIGDLEALLAAGDLEAAGQFIAAVGFDQFEDRAEIAGLERLVGLDHDRLDIRTRVLDAGETDALGQAVQANQRLEEEPVGDLGGLRAECANRDGLLEDLAQFLLALGGDPLEGVFDLTGLERPAAIGDGRAIGSIAMGLGARQHGLQDSGEQPIEHLGLLCFEVDEENLRGAQMPILDVNQARPLQGLELDERQAVAKTTPRNLASRLASLHLRQRPVAPKGANHIRATPIARATDPVSSLTPDRSRQPSSQTGATDRAAK